MTEYTKDQNAEMEDLDKEDIEKAKASIDEMLMAKLLDSEVLKAYFEGHNAKLPEFFAALTAIVKEDQHANDNVINADKQSTTDYMEILNDQLKYLREQCKNVTTEEERNELFKQTKDILERLREEKREQRDYMIHTNDEQKKQTRFFAMVGGTVLAIGALGITMAVTRNPGKAIDVAKSAIKIVK